MQKRKGKSPHSAFRPTVNPRVTFPTGSPGSSCCGLRNSRARGPRTELFPSHSEQGSPLSSQSKALGKNATLSSSANTQHLRPSTCTSQLRLSSTRASNKLMPETQLPHLKNEDNTINFNRTVHSIPSPYVITRVNSFLMISTWKVHQMKHFNKHIFILQTYVIGVNITIFSRIDDELQKNKGE